MKVRHGEGVANHIGPEPCVAVRKDVDEASVGEGIGKAPGGWRARLVQVQPR